MQLPLDLDEYGFAWQESDNVQFDLQKLDHIWRVLKYGERNRKFEDYYHVQYGDSHLIISMRVNPYIVGAFTAEELPAVHEGYENSKHALSKMMERRIHSKDRTIALRNHLVYDRLGHYKWKLLSVISGERVFLVVDSRNERVITMWRD
ncbi:hypothetical protein M199_gp149 [Halogranum tailed virus 1]|uniref:Uncharacterized protein n=1 Tax=Halogranum tailed virus 1 TaxID=1273749 RepID=R4TLF3_9CAUD|nr:hypothetical protein M199_gp149 [Halogranum tailed virus 1]AGM11517.1 hypothetical protein HGTV1_220 [Halogranum tailed virus 1]